MTPFKIITGICGLSQREAAAFLDTRIDTVKSWSSGRNPAPEGVIRELAELALKIDIAADEAVAEIERLASAHGANADIELGLAADDHEAESLGWPCASCHAAVIGLAAIRAMGQGYTVRIVPRGSTVATAAAADAHDN